MGAVCIALLTSAVLLGNDQLSWVAAVVPFAFVLVAKAMSLYDRDEHLLHKTTLDEVPALFGLATLMVLLLFLANGTIVDGELGRRQILGTWILLFVLLVCLRALARGIALRTAPPERCMLIGPATTARYVREQMRVSPAVRAELVEAVPAVTRTPGNGSSAELPREVGELLIARQIDRVILPTGSPDSPRDELLYTIRELKTFGVKVSVLPEVSRVAGLSVEIDHLHGMTLLGMRRFEFTRSSKLVKRVMDVIGSGAALIVLSPLLVTIAIAIRLSSPGPVLFRQRRVGRYGDEFEMLKFRSMINEAEQRKDELQHLNRGASGLFKIPDDPRVTRIGRWLRMWQLDELPQLINVLRGEMSLVGSRPLIPQEDRLVEGWYRRRLDLPPGITGHWQILGSSQMIPLDEMVKLDYLYAANWSAWNDLRILLRTVPFIAGRRGL